MLVGKLNWIAFIGIYVGLFLMTQPFSEAIRIEALANWGVVAAGFVIYFIGVVFSVFGFLQERTTLRWINLIGMLIGVVLLSVFMFV